MPASVSLAAARSKALSGRSWKLALEKPGTSTPRISIWRQPNSAVAPIWEFRKLPASSPIPINNIRVLSVERLSKIVVLDLHHLLFELRIGDQLLQFLLVSGAVHRQVHR